jgi:hypothetical protein
VKTYAVVQKGKKVMRVRIGLFYRNVAEYKAGLVCKMGVVNENGHSVKGLSVPVLLATLNGRTDQFRDLASGLSDPEIERLITERRALKVSEQDFAIPERA